MLRRPAVVAQGKKTTAIGATAAIAATGLRRPAVAQGKEREDKEAAKQQRRQKQQQNRSLTTVQGTTAATVGMPRPAVAQDKEGKGKAASTVAVSLRPADPQAQTAIGKKKASCSKCGGYHQGECRKLECQRCLMHHWPQQACTKRVEKSWLRGSATSDLLVMLLLCSSPSTI